MSGNAFGSGAFGSDVLSVTVAGAAAEAVARRVPGLVSDAVATSLFAGDATLWGRDAQDEAGKRLGWTAAAVASQQLVAPLAELRAELHASGVDRVVLCGMGGSSLAPEVIAAASNVPLVVLDSSDPDRIRGAVVELERTVVVVSSKSGGTLETDSQRRAFEAGFTAAGIDPSTRIVVVTDPGSPLEEQSRAAGYRVFLADPDVGGRYSALTAFGLVPSALAGVDVEALLKQATTATELLMRDTDDNPALVLGAAMAGSEPLRDKLVLAADGAPLPGFGDWAEQLIAESTGKLGTGLLPVVVDSTAAPEVTTAAPDVTIVRLVADAATADVTPTDGRDPALVTVSGSLGAQFMLWETATVVAGRLLGINPFDQPDVESAKQAARGLLDDRPADVEPVFVDGAVQVRATDGLVPAGTTSLAAAIDALLGQLDAHGYVAVMAYLDSTAQGELTGARDTLAARTDRPVTFGWGPRFLHSTGQFHKGGPATGVYLQLTGDPVGDDVAIPDRPFGSAHLISAQAAGDARVLADRGRPVLRLHLTDRAAGVAQVLAAIGSVGPAGGPSA